MFRKGLPLSPESWGRKLASGESRGSERDLGQAQRHREEEGMGRWSGPGYLDERDPHHQAPLWG